MQLSPIHRGRAAGADQEPLSAAGMEEAFLIEQSAAAAAKGETKETKEDMEERLRWIELHRLGARCMIGGGVIVGLVSLGGIIYGWSSK